MEQLKLVMVISITLFVIFMGNLFISAAETADAATLREATENGAAMGTIDGQAAGFDDRYAGKVSNYSLVIPDDVNIISRFALSKDSDSYKNNFVLAYKEAFQIAYNTAYRSYTINEYTVSVELATTHGDTAGDVEGKLAALKDITNGISNNWKTSYDNLVKNESIFDKYNLSRENYNYRKNFTSAFIKSFMKNYTETYQIANLEYELKNHNSKTVTRYETTLYFDENLIHFTAGNLEYETKTPVSVYFPEDALYLPTQFVLFKSQNSFNFLNYQYTPVSSVYTFTNISPAGSVKLLKPITISFDYAGSERAGIYQLVNGTWKYLFTEMDNNKISTTIPAGFYEGGDYAVFIDESFKYVNDIRFNWAYKEIFTLIRRGVISDDSLYFPNRSISRAEFSQLIYNTLSKSDPNYLNAPIIKDQSKLGDFKEAVEYVVSKRYLTLDSKGNFNPSASISYKEVEQMLSGIFLRDVKWSEIGNKMLTEKFTRSMGLTNINAPVNKAEAAFMLIYYFK